MSLETTPQRREHMMNVRITKDDRETLYRWSQVEGFPPGSIVYSLIKKAVEEWKANNPQSQCDSCETQPPAK